MLQLPKKLFVPGEETLGLKRINKHCNLKLVDEVEKALGDDFQTIEESFLGPIVRMAKNHRKLSFSRNVVHQLLQRRILVESKALWFCFEEQPMRFSLRDFFLATNLPCVVEGESTPMLKKKKKKNTDKWMEKGQTVNNLLGLLEKKGHSMSSNQKIRLGATILVEGILVANNPVNQIPLENLLRAEDFAEFCSLPWGNIAFNSLVEGVKALTVDMLQREQYGLSGLCYAIQLWALSSVTKLGEMYGTKDGESAEFLLCLSWTHTTTPTESEVKIIADNEKVDVRVVIGDQALHSNLIGDTDPVLEKLLDLQNQGYRMKRSNWLKGSVDIEAAVEALKILNPDQTDFDSKEDRIKYLSNLVEGLRSRVKELEHLLGINQQSQEPFGQQEGSENSDLLVSFVNKHKKRKRKTKEVEREEQNTEHELNMPPEEIVPTNAHEPETAGGEASNPQEVVPGQNTEHELNMPGEPDNKRDEREIDEEECVLAKDKDEEPQTPGAEASKAQEKKSRGGNSVHMIVTNVLEDLQEREKIGSPLTDEDVERKLKDSRIHPIYGAFEPYVLARKISLDQWKEASKKRLFKDGLGNEVNTQWFTQLETPGNRMTKEQMETAIQLLLVRRKRNPNLYPEEKPAIYGEDFVITLEECIKKWEKDPNCDFGNKIKAYITGKLPEFANTGEKWISDIKVIYAPRLLNAKEWVVLVIQLEERAVSIWSSTNINYKDVALSYAKIMPVLLKLFIRGVKDNSDFEVKLEPPFLRKVTDGETCVETGLYALKNIECCANRTKIFTKLHDENIKTLRTKLAVDIFAELNSEVEAKTKKRKVEAGESKKKKVTKG